MPMTGESYDPAREGAQMAFDGRMSYGDYLDLDRILAAQHPLRGGIAPGQEFEQRLRLGHALWQVEVDAGRRVELYVPGSRHRHEGVDDHVSLSEAGCAFLHRPPFAGKT
jgi:hypothetical protein